MLEVNDDWTVAVPGLVMLLVSTSRGLGANFNTWPRLEPRFELENWKPWFAPLLDLLMHCRKLRGSGLRHELGRHPRSRTGRRYWR
jgi:hypothetical protein